MQLGDLKSAMERYRQLKQSQAQGQLPVQQNPDMLRQSMQARPRQAGMLETMMGVGRQFREDPLNALKVMANRAISGPETNVTTGLEPGPIEKFMGRGSRSIADSVQDFYSSKVPEFLARHNAPEAVQNIAKVGGAIAGTGSEIIAQSMDESSPAFSQAGIAFHGTPHLFDKFKMSKLGTGEGAQAYGHGLYFAESKGVARQYANDLARAKMVHTEGQGFSMSTFAVKDKSGPLKLKTALDKSAAQRLAESKGSIDDAINLVAGIPQHRATPWDDRVLSKLERWKKAGVEIEMSKYLYKVDIPDEKVAGMLDWDKPLSEQPKDVMDGALKAMLQEGGTGNPSLTGQQIYDFISHGDKSGKASKTASDKLNKLGIPGIKYLDQGSRTAGEGTRNIVAFDDKIVNILEVNGKKVGATKPSGEFPIADKSVSGMLVREDVPNMGSIEASLEQFEILKGVREVKFSAFDDVAKPVYNSADDKARTMALAEEIKKNKEINPLIVAIDEQGPYIIEGGHRFDALKELGVESFPAVVVKDTLNRGAVKDYSRASLEGAGFSFARRGKEILIMNKQDGGRIVGSGVTMDDAISLAKREGELPLLEGVAKK